MSLGSSIRIDARLGFWSGERSDFANWEFLTLNKLRILNPRYMILLLNPWRDVVDVIDEEDAARNLRVQNKKEKGQGKPPMAKPSSSTSTSTSTSTELKVKVDSQSTQSDDDNPHQSSATDILESGVDLFTSGFPRTVLMTKGPHTNINPNWKQSPSATSLVFQSSHGLVVKQANILVPDIETALKERQELSYLLLTSVSPQTVKG